MIRDRSLVAGTLPDDWTQVQGHRLLVTCQAIGQSGHLLLRLLQVTLQTPAHIHPHHWAHHLHLADIAMAGLAVDPSAEMGLMAEVDEVGLLVHAPPGDRFPTLPES